MGDRLRFFMQRIRERLWIRPLITAMLSVVFVFLAKVADDHHMGERIPSITQESIETLLAIISASMLVIATFAVASMVSAYASASRTATPRSFTLILADDRSQNALSTFVGAFIYSTVALIALQNDFYDRAGRFALFVMTLMVLAMVIITFVRWVDCIARLGQLGGTIEKVEAEAAKGLLRRRSMPTLRGVPLGLQPHLGQAIYSRSIGYVQRIEINVLQAWAEKSGMHISVAALPGSFATPGRALAYVTADSGDTADIDPAPIADAFIIGTHREFDEDPRFGLVVLAEIASRALSPAVNDPGTAIGIISSFVRLFALWSAPSDEGDNHRSECDRVVVPELELRDLFDDAFSAIARDGAGTIEVAGRLQKAFASLASMDDARMRDEAIQHARLALVRAEFALSLPQDLEVVRAIYHSIVQREPLQ